MFEAVWEYLKGRANVQRNRAHLRLNPEIIDTFSVLALSGVSEGQHFICSQRPLSQFNQRADGYSVN